MYSEFCILFIDKGPQICISLTTHKIWICLFGGSIYHLVGMGRAYVLLIFVSTTHIRCLIAGCWKKE